MSDTVELPRYAWRPVGVVTAVVVVVLAITVDAYGYHRDELYFRMLAAHPAWGYVDEPPMTPMLVRASTSVFGDSLWALRLPAILCAVATLLIVALICRDLGGRAYAQTITTIGVAASFLLVSGHTMLTTAPDMVVWTLVILFVLRAIERRQDRWWIYTGITVGLGLYNKQLVLLLLIALAGGLLIAGPRRVLVGRGLWLGMLIAVVIALPTFIYQITDHFPELHMTRAISADKGPSDRISYLPFQIVLVAPLWIYGFVSMFTAPAWRRLRFMGWAYAVLSVVVLLTGGQIYYSFGLLTFFMAVSAVRLQNRRVPDGWVVAVLAIAVVCWSLIALPTIPVAQLHDTPIPGINQAARDTVGWPVYVRQVGTAFATLSPDDRVHTTIVTANYGEAGAIDKFGDRYHLPKVYSGQNQLYDYGPPPESATVAILTGYDTDEVPPAFGSCTVAGTFDNGVDVDNEEQGLPVLICRARTASWVSLWPSFQHYS